MRHFCNFDYCGDWVGNWMSLMVMVGLVILTAVLAGAVRLIYRGHAFCGALIGVGALGFVAPTLLPAAGTWLRHVELPSFFETTSIVTSEGQKLTATVSLSRIQRYGSDGRFETGWFVNSAGGIFAIGLTQSGQIAVAAARTKQVEFFNPDGSSAGPPRPFTWSGGMVKGVLRPSNCSVEGVTFVDPVPAEGPRAHWAPLVLFPLSHPVIGWLLAALGAFGVWFKRHQNRHAESPQS